MKARLNISEIAAALAEFVKEHTCTCNHGLIDHMKATCSKCRKCNGFQSMLRRSVSDGSGTMD